tara:strand:- start:844 stop:999 length:156 start_codon:yes stop_codon:yes gene_type:complete
MLKKKRKRTSAGAQPAHEPATASAETDASRGDLVLSRFGLGAARRAAGFPS